MYLLPKLPYSFQELEPYIDTHTMGVHYHKHHQNYLNKLNDLLKKNNYDYRYNLNELLYHVNEFPEKDRQDILFNLGGVLNHNLYWKSMNPNPQKPLGKLKLQIDKKYGSYEKFWAVIKKEALELKGSGYVFLVLKNNGEIDVITSFNQDTPLFVNFIPLFNIDMWEHAYYLNYKNEKSDYLDNFEKIADFDNANQMFNNIVK